MPVGALALGDVGCRRNAVPKMDKKWRHRGSRLILLRLISILCWISVVKLCNTEQEVRDESVLDRELKNYVDRVLGVDVIHIIPGVEIEKAANNTFNNTIKNTFTDKCIKGRHLETVEEYAGRKLDQYSKSHMLSVNLRETARFLIPGDGKSSFLTGFGMGFLAFGLKKLLLPVFIGAQLIKSVLIAMFLPSILGGLGKIVGKGLSTFSGISGASTGINNNNQYSQVEDFEFKDTDPYSNDLGGIKDINNDANQINHLNPDEEINGHTNSRRQVIVLYIA
ncbi:hypothetical protein NQ317_015468 [Molorchus minor]|uniref:Uncharacterized protein n=1 Tax=Molorchus minor TaxID=1323400 RepID=A0ABQ9IZJ7_9CUCU|nr:hypothetical protein NQ317_015468 [Molorchus minor]